MKLTNQLLLLVIFFLSLTENGFGQRAKDGDYIASTSNNIVNAYTFLTVDASAGATSITVDNNSLIGGVVFGSALAPGDLILIIQMQGASVNIDTGPVDFGFGDYTISNGHLWSSPPDWFMYVNEYGEVTNYNNSGKFEQVEVAGISGGNTISLQCGLKNNYTVSGHVQIVRVPRFNNLTVSGGLASIIPTTWNGQTGGIVAIEVDATMDLNAGSSISASGFGFRAGQLDNVGTSGSTANPDDFTFFGSSQPVEGSEKGEGIFGYYAELDAIYSRYGIGAAANGGGGGGYQNCGGGGGSNLGAGIYSGNGVPDPAYTATWNLDISGLPGTAPTPIGGTSTPGGGRGGYSLAETDQDELVVGPRNASWGGDARKTNGGRGGHPLTYDATRIFFGGGGGAGDQDSQQGGAGGRGGGIVYITNYGSTVGAGSIEVNGESGQNSNPNNESPSFFAPRKGNDGAGGGGAGGAIYIENATALPGSISLIARGGDGGDQNLSYNGSEPDEASGPGGSGAGGSIAYNSGTPIEILNAGANGVVNSTHFTPFVPNFPPNGATNGAVGIGGLPSGYFDLTALDVSICSGNTADLSVTILGVLPAGATIEWYTQEFGGASINSGLAYTTPVLLATTTYYVGVCPGTFRIPIIVTVVPSDDPTFTLTPTCDGATATITGTSGGTFSFDTPPLDAAIIDPVTGTITGGSSGGVYDVIYVTGGICPDSLVVQVTASTVDDASFTMTPNCTGGTATVTGTPGGIFSFNTAPVDAAVIDPITGEVTGGTPGASYDIMYATSGACAASSTLVFNTSAADDPSFTMTPTCFGATAVINGTPGGTFTFNTPPLDAALIDGTTGTITNGTTGTTYDVLYSTSGACAASSTQLVTAATDLSYTPTLVDENCGAGDGSITLLANGGDGGPYQYSITGGAPYDLVGSYSGLSAGSFNISVLDNSGCEITGIETISGTGGPIIDSLVSTGPTCNGLCDGIIVAYVSGGTSPYSYQWLDNLGNPIGTDNDTLFNVCAGDYSVQVIDAGGGGLVYYFNEDFGSDGVTCSSQGTLANGYNSGSGVWTTVATGLNDVDANLWFVSTMEEGVGAGNCGTGCSVGGPGIDRTLHLSNPAIPAFGLVADQGAAYNAGGGCPAFFCVATDVRAESPAINLAGSAMTLSFDYIHLGDGTDQCELMYFDGTIWNSLGILPNTSVGACAGGQHTWASYTWAIPVALNGLANFQIGFRWYNNDDGSGTDPSVAIDNVAIVELTAACPALANISVIDPPPVNLLITDPAAVCSPNTVDIAAAGVTSGSDAGTLTYWTDMAATNALTTPSAVAATGTYYIQLDNGTCSVVQAVNVTINALPTVAATNTGPYCPGDAISVSETGGQATGWSWLSNGAAVITNPTDQTPIVSGAANGEIFTVMGTDGNGCTNTGQTTITINTPATGIDVQVACIDYLWIDGVTYSASTNIPTYTYPGGAVNGCDSTVTLDLTINDCELIIPSAFTPDNDQYNDFWEIIGLDEQYPENQVFIYNRWGNLLFESIQGAYTSKEWDGTFKGKKLPVGSYYYIIEFHNQNNDSATGVVSIILNN